MKRNCLLMILILFCSFYTYAQIKNPLKFSFSTEKANDSISKIYFKVNIEKGWHLFSQNNTSKDGTIPSTAFEFYKSNAYQLIGKVIEPKGIEKIEPLFDSAKVIYFENEVIFTQQIKIITNDSASVKGNIITFICNDRGCMPIDKDFSIEIRGSVKN